MYTWLNKNNTNIQKIVLEQTSEIHERKSKRIKKILIIFNVHYMKIILY